MLIVEGKGNKFSKVKEIIEGQDKLVLIINTSEERLDFQTQKKHIFLDQTKETIDMMMDTGLLYQSVSSHPFEVGLVIFYIDGTKEDIAKIESFEKEVDMPCVVTIENDSLDEVRVYTLMK